MKQAGLPFALKRGLDIVVATTVAVAATPVIAVAAASIRATMGRPVLFRQSRPGRGAQPFVLYKFRTMRPSSETDVNPEHDAARLTPVGRLLRATSVDELPQLWNVIRGDMSLVGPRPLLMKYLPRYSPEQARRHEVMPGITGWAQINGRNATSWARKFALDIWYVDHWSPWLDLSILARTAVAVLRRDGISNEGHVTMPEFKGTPSDGSSVLQ